MIDPESKKPVEGHVVPVPYGIGRVTLIDWGFMRGTVDTLLAQGYLVDDSKPAAQT